MRSLERTYPSARRRNVCFRKSDEAAARDGVVPERSAPRLEPGVFWSKCAGPSLEGLTCLANARGVAFFAQRHLECLKRLERTHGADWCSLVFVSPMQNKVFFPQEALDQWILDGTIDLKGSELTIVAEARRYKLADAVRVLREVSGTADANELVGRVKSKGFLLELGAEILEGSMIVGDNAYDIVQGWTGVPVGSFDEHFASAERAKARAMNLDNFTPEEPKTEEQLLARFLMKNL